MYLALRAPPKGLGSGTRTLEGSGFEEDGVPAPLLTSAIRSHLQEILSAARTPRSWTAFCHGVALFVLQWPFDESPSILVASRAARRLQQVESQGLFASVVVPIYASSLDTCLPISASILSTCSCSASIVTLVASICGSDTNCHTP